MLYHRSTVKKTAEKSTAQKRESDEQNTHNAHNLPSDLSVFDPCSAVDNAERPSKENSVSNTSTSNVDLLSDVSKT